MHVNEMLRGRTKLQYLMTWDEKALEFYARGYAVIYRNKLFFNDAFISA